MKEINNIQELKKAMQPMMIKMVDDMADRVYETLNYFLQDYYTGWTPSTYKRTQDFLRSAVKVNAKTYGDSVRAYVFIDYKSLKSHGEITGLQMVKWADEGLHGGISVEHEPHVWSDTIDNTINNGALLKMAINYLKSKGFTVTVQ